MATCHILANGSTVKNESEALLYLSKEHGAWHASRYQRPAILDQRRTEGIMKSLLGMLIVFGVAFGAWPSNAEAQSCPGGLMSRQLTECRTAVLNACVFVSPPESAACEAAALQRYILTQQIVQRGAVSPISAWHCPTSHPIKGNFTTYNGERCIFHSPGGQFYEKTKPEMCYATPADAAVDGCRASLR